MNRILSLGLIVVVVLTMLFVAGCSCGAATATQTVTTTAPAKTVAAPPSTAIPPISTSISAPASQVAGGGLNWNDMPVYSGATNIQSASWAVPPAGGDYSKVEWRYYTSGDSISAVASFYKAQMPGQGWQQTAWIDTQQGSWGSFTKNNEQDAALVWIGPGEGNTSIALMRATE